MVRPAITERSTVSPSVARRDTEAIRASARWRVAPSSTGAGIVDQSGASTVLFTIDLPAASGLYHHHRQARRCLRRPARLRVLLPGVQDVDDLHSRLGYAIDDDVIGMGDEFARAGDSSGSE